MTLPQISKDIVEFLALLDRHDVRYLLVGAVSVIYHGRPRYTGDVDVYYDRAAANVERLHAALRDFWGGSIPGGIGPADLAEAGAVVQFGRPPNRLDLMNEIDGVTFDEAWADRVGEEIDGAKRTRVWIMGRESLQRNKRASGRPKDLDDLEGLG